MSDNPYTEPQVQVEGLDELMTRDRPLLTNLWPDVFGELSSCSLVNIYGLSGAGKSMFIMELMANIIMRDDLNNVEALFVELDGKFNVFKLTEICMKLIKNSDLNDSTDCVKDFVKPRLHKLHISTIENFDKSLFTRISRILTENTRIGIVLIDSLGGFYEKDPTSSESSEETSSDDSNIQKPPKTSEPYKASSSSDSSVCSSDDEGEKDELPQYLEELRKIIQKFQVSVVYVRPTGYVESRDVFANIHIELRKVNSEIFHMKIQNSKELAFSIGFYGIQIADQQNP